MCGEKRETFFEFLRRAGFCPRLRQQRAAKIRDALFAFRLNPVARANENGNADERQLTVFRDVGHRPAFQRHAKLLGLGRRELERRERKFFRAIGNCGCVGRRSDGRATGFLG